MSVGTDFGMDSKWFLPMQGGSSEKNATSETRVRLVQPKELFPACEYKSILDVYGCTLEYSDDGTTWIPAFEFNIVDGRSTRTWLNPKDDPTPHKYWRVNLNGLSKPEDPQDEYTDRGFRSFGRLWNTVFRINRQVEKKTVVGGAEYTFSAHALDWQVNTVEPVDVDISFSPSISNAIFPPHRQMENYMQDKMKMGMLCYQCPCRRLLYRWPQ